MAVYDSHMSSMTLSLRKYQPRPHQHYTDMWGRGGYLSSPYSCCRRWSFHRRSWNAGHFSTLLVTDKHAHAHHTHSHTHTHTHTETTWAAESGHSIVEVSRTEASYLCANTTATFPPLRRQNAVQTSSSQPVRYGHFLENQANDYQCTRTQERNIGTSTLA